MLTYGKKRSRPTTRAPPSVMLDASDFLHMPTVPLASVTPPAGLDSNQKAKRTRSQQAIPENSSIDSKQESIEDDFFEQLPFLSNVRKQDKRILANKATLPAFKSNANHKQDYSEVTVTLNPVEILIPDAESDVIKATSPIVEALTAKVSLRLPNDNLIKTIRPKRVARMKPSSIAITLERSSSTHSSQPEVSPIIELPVAATKLPIRSFVSAFQKPVTKRYGSAPAFNNQAANTTYGTATTLPYQSEDMDGMFHDSVDAIQVDEGLESSDDEVFYS